MCRERAGRFVGLVWRGRGFGSDPRPGDLLALTLAFLLVVTGAAVAQEPAWPDFSKIKPLDIDALTLDEMHRVVGAGAVSEPRRGGDDFQIALSTSNSSGPPVVCDGPYVDVSWEGFCRELVLNESYLAVLTTRDGPAAASGDDVQEWLDRVGGNFELAWTSPPAPPQPNASRPSVKYVQSTPNATSVPGDLHVFFRAAIGVGIEKMIDSLVRSRVDDWYFSPMFRWRYNFSWGSSLSTFHGLISPRTLATTLPWPQSNFRQVIPALQAAAGSGDRIERTTFRLGHYERFSIYPASRDGLDQLDLVTDLEAVPDVFAGWSGEVFLLPGDSLPVGGPSGGPGGGGGAGATAVPISSPLGRALLALVLALAAIYWMRRS